MSVYSVDAKNHSDLWRGCIKYVPEFPRDESKRYVLYATGEASMNGRIYVALPEQLMISKEMKNKYHIRSRVAYTSCVHVSLYVQYIHMHICTVYICAYVYT